MLHSKGPNGGNPILEAVLHKHMDLVKFLMPKYKTLDVQDDIGASVLHIATTNFDIFNEIYLNYLSKLNPNLLDENGRSALHWICNEDMVTDKDVTDQERFLIVMKLMTIMSNIDNQDIFGKTALHYAMTWKNKKIIKLLRKHKMRPKRGATEFDEKTMPNSKRFKRNQKRDNKIY